MNYKSSEKNVYVEAETQVEYLRNDLNKNNIGKISGKVVQELSDAHEDHGEMFYDFKVSVLRNSGKEDIIPICISEKLIKKPIKVGDEISAVGQFRSRNKIIDGRSKLFLSFFVRELVEKEEIENPNQIKLIGYICKPSVKRYTPFEREIADVLIAVNRSYNKSDYIPCIAWGRNAGYVSKLPVGTKVSINGRIQSREYQKKISETEIENRTAYEVSICSIFENEAQNPLTQGMN